MGRKIANLLKLSLCVINILNVIAGIILITIGSFTITVAFDTVDLHASIIIIVSGSVLIFVVILGCYGSIRDSFIILICFSVGMSLAALLDISGTIVAGILKMNSEQRTREHLEQGVINYNTSEIYRNLWDSLHKRHECCGIDGFKDWKDKGMDLPESCCYELLSNVNETSKEHVLCRDASQNRKYLHENGCLQPYRRSVDKACNFIIIATLVMCCLKIIAIAMGCCLGFNIREIEE